MLQCVYEFQIKKVTNNPRYNIPCVLTGNVLVY